MYPSHRIQCLFFTPLSLRGHPRKGTKEDGTKEPKYNNVYEQRREKPTTLLCTVDECWEFKGISGFAFVIFHWLGRTYSRSIHYSTESIRWHSIADGINIKNLYTFLRVYISGWLCKLLLLSLFSVPARLPALHKSNHFVIKMRSD